MRLSILRLLILTFRAMKRVATSRQSSAVTFEFDEDEASAGASGDGAGGGVVISAGKLRLRELLRRVVEWDPAPVSKAFGVVLLPFMLLFRAQRTSLAISFFKKSKIFFVG